MTSTVLLRRYALEDAPVVLLAIQESQPELHRWLQHMRPDMTEADVLAWIQMGVQSWDNREVYNFAIIDQAGRFLGGCGLSQVHPVHRFANLYYWVRRSGQGQGVAPQAVRLLARFGFEQAGLQRVEIVVEPGNLPSLRTAEKAGATREGLLRNRLNNSGQARDAYMFSLVPGDLGSPVVGSSGSRVKE